MVLLWGQHIIIWSKYLSLNVENETVYQNRWCWTCDLRHSELESLRRFSEKRMPFELRPKGQIIYMVDIKEVSFWEGYGWESRMSLAHLRAGRATSWFFFEGGFNINTGAILWCSWLKTEKRICTLSHAQWWANCFLF